MNTVQEQNTNVETATPAERQYTRPFVNIFETQDAYTLEADMPGVQKNGIEVTLEDNELILTGHREESAPQNASLTYRESRAADYRRSFELAPEIDPEKITAKIENGVLTVLLPKAEQVKPRRIEVS
jgi:HSP20 family protein